MISYVWGRDDYCIRPKNSELHALALEGKMVHKKFENHMCVEIMISCSFQVMLVLVVYYTIIGILSKIERAIYII